MGREVLGQKSVILKVTISGIRQRHEFFIEHGETAFGRIPFLACRRALPVGEMMRIANENDLPVRCPGQQVFPNGKGPKDFLGL
ncbi:MAG: hypothetical protein PHS02_01150 [Candidatus ainarchaeum sp.]|nr:hypothetical protein [Candidatus ainarchaeum sp.]